MAQEVSRLPLTTEARLRSQASPCEMWWTHLQRDSFFVSTPNTKVFLETRNMYGKCARETLVKSARSFEGRRRKWSYTVEQNLKEAELWGGWRRFRGLCSVGLLWCWPFGLYDHSYWNVCVPAVMSECCRRLSAYGPVNELIRCWVGGGKDSWNVRGFQTIINYTSTAHRFKPIAPLSDLPVAPEMLLADLSECFDFFFFFFLQRKSLPTSCHCYRPPSSPPPGHLYPATSCGSAVIASATSILISISSPLSPPLPSRFLILPFSSLPYVRTFYFLFFIFFLRFLSFRQFPFSV